MFSAQYPKKYHKSPCYGSFQAKGTTSITVLFYGSAPRGGMNTKDQSFKSRAGTELINLPMSTVSRILLIFFFLSRF